MDEVCQVMTTVGERSAADLLVRSVVEQKLAACAQITRSRGEHVLVAGCHRDRRRVAGHLQDHDAALSRIWPSTSGPTTRTTCPRSCACPWSTATLPTFAGWLNRRSHDRCLPHGGFTTGVMYAEFPPGSSRGTSVSGISTMMLGLLMIDASENTFPCGDERRGIDPDHAPEPDLFRRTEHLGRCRPSEDRIEIDPNRWTLGATVVQIQQQPVTVW